MREIKFRAWDKKLNKFYEPVYEAYKGNLYELVVSFNGHLFERDLHSSAIKGTTDEKGEDRYILMQYTGLKDKNEKEEIYESDIVKYLQDICIVRWSEVLCRFVMDKYFKGGKLIHGYYFFNEETVCDIEIIGNIHENPELLEAK